MKTGLKQDKAETGIFTKTFDYKCRNCRKHCSGSGLCIKSWPETPVREPEEGINKDKGGC